jgi:hypothetical protein
MFISVLQLPTPREYHVGNNLSLHQFAIGKVVLPSVPI